MGKKVKFGKFRKRRIKIDLTQQELAEQTDINILIIKALETGRSDTTYENFKKITDYLKIDIDEVYIEDFKDSKVFTYNCLC